MDKVHHSSEKMDWGTPWDIFTPLDAEFRFGLDVCASKENTKCHFFITEEDVPDGLNADWSKAMYQTCWMNPPYGRIELPKWIQKAWDEKQEGVTTVCLVPSRTDTRWWAIFWDHENHRPRDPRDEVRFIKGRIKFIGAENAAPFPSAIVVLRGVENLVWCARCCADRHPRAVKTCGHGRACGLRKENSAAGVQS